MTSKVIILRALPWGNDSRVERWGKIYSKRIPLYGIWGEKKAENIKSITNIIREPKNKFIIGIGYIWFSIMSFFFVLKNAKKKDVVVFIDLETILFAWVAAFIKGADIHYDIADPFYLVKPIPFKKFWKVLETIFVNKVKLVTAPHIKRFKIYFDELKPNMKVVENVPIFDKKMDYNSNRIENDKITIGYFGILEAKYRGLENLAKLVLDDERFELLIAGSGPLYDFFLNLSKKCDRIIFLGKYDSQDLPELVKDINIYFGYYSENKTLHKIASPNKFYEHLFFRKPILTSTCIPHSEEIKKYDTGWCISNDEDELVNWKNSLFRERVEFEDYAIKCKKRWDEKYENYYRTLSFE